MPTQIENATSKPMGTSKPVKSAAKGLSGVFRTLIQEHREVSALMARLEGSSDVELRRRLFPLIRKELLSHERAELAVLYPEFELYQETAQLAGQHNREAQSMEALIERLHALDVASEHWSSNFAELVEAVKQHVRDEDSTFFPKGELAMGSRKADALDYRYHATKQEVIAKL